MGISCNNTQHDAKTTLSADPVPGQEDLSAIEVFQAIDAAEKYLEQTIQSQAIKIFTPFRCLVIIGLSFVLAYSIIQMAINLALTPIMPIPLLSLSGTMAFALLGAFIVYTVEYAVKYEEWVLDRRTMDALGQMLPEPVKLDLIEKIKKNTLNQHAWNLTAETVIRELSLIKAEHNARCRSEHLNYALQCLSSPKKEGVQ